MSTLAAYRKDAHVTTTNERMRRFLLSTSYNLACITQLGLAIGLDYLDDEDEKEALAVNLDSTIQDIDLDTYLRTFVIIVSDKEVKISARATDLDLLKDRVRDHPSQHEEILVLNSVRRHASSTWDDHFMTAFMTEVTSLLAERRVRIQNVDVEATQWLGYQGVIPLAHRRGNKSVEWDTCGFDDVLNALRTVFLHTGRITFTTRTICTRPNGRTGWTFRHPHTA